VLGAELMLVGIGIGPEFIEPVGGKMFLIGY
jgi:hypothetical protein